MSISNLKAELKKIRHAIQPVSDHEMIFRCHSGECRLLRSEFVDIFNTLDDCSRGLLPQDEKHEQ